VVVVVVVTTSALWSESSHDRYEWNVYEWIRVKRILKPRRWQTTQLLPKCTANTHHLYPVPGGPDQKISFPTPAFIFRYNPHVLKLCGLPVNWRYCGSSVLDFSTVVRVCYWLDMQHAYGQWQIYRPTEFYYVTPDEDKEFVRCRCRGEANNNVFYVISYIAVGRTTGLWQGSQHLLYHVIRSSTGVYYGCFSLYREPFLQGQRGLRMKLTSHIDLV